MKRQVEQRAVPDIAAGPNAAGERVALEVIEEVQKCGRIARKP